MSSQQAHDVQTMVGVYKRLFILLASVTALGICLSYLHMPLYVTVLISLFIIAIKSKIVLDAFKGMLPGRMGLIILFGLTVIFFVAVILLPLFNSTGHIPGTVDTSKEAAALHPDKEVEGAHGH